MAVDAGSFVWALGDDGGAEGIVELGVGAGEGVVEADAEGEVLGDGEGWCGGSYGEGEEEEKEGEGVFGARGDLVQRRPFVFWG